MQTDGTLILAGANMDDSHAGEPGSCDSGAVYVFRHDGAGWLEDPKIFAWDRACNEQFGRAISYDSTRLIVGAQNGKVPTDNGNLGAGYVFERTGGGWSQVGDKLVAPGVVIGDHFGSSVAISGSRAVIGATATGSFRGAAYVFHWDGAQWDFVKELSATTPAANDHFGQAVAIDGEWILVGAPRAVENMVPTGGAGAVYVFRLENGSWVRKQTLTSPDHELNEQRFGNHLAIRGPRFVVGAIFHNRLVPDETGAGEAFVYRLNGDTWVHEATLQASDATSNDEFGIRVAIDGEVIVVGAHQDDPIPDSGNNHGSAYVFRRDAISGEWTQECKMQNPDPVETIGDHLGAGVAVSGDLVAVAAPIDNDETFQLSRIGTVYAFDLAGLACNEPPPPGLVDQDGDGFPACRGDCDDQDPTAWRLPGEATDLVWTDVSTIMWVGAEPGGTAALFDVVRSTDAADFEGAATCAATDVTGTKFTDITTSGIGTSLYYLVVVENGCGAGSAGVTSAGSPRSVRSCP